MTKLIINRNENYSMLNSSIISTNEANQIRIKALKMGLAKLVLDSETTLMYHIQSDIINTFKGYAIIVERMNNKNDIREEVKNWNFKKMQISLIDSVGYYTVVPDNVTFTYDNEIKYSELFTAPN